MAEKTNGIVIGIDDPLPGDPGFVERDNLTSERSENGNATIQRSDERSNGVTESVNGIPLINPIDFDAPRTVQRTDSGDRPKRRGRPPGSRNRTYGSDSTGGSGNAAAQASGSLDFIEEVLSSVHFMAARFFDEKDIELTDDESKRLGKAIRNVAKHYAVNVDPKKVALFQLATTATGIYGPRVMKMYNRKQSAPAPKLVQMQPRADVKTSNKVDPATSATMSPTQLFESQGLAFNHEEN